MVEKCDLITFYGFKELSEKVGSMNQEFKAQIQGLKEEEI